MSTTDLDWRDYVFALDYVREHPGNPFTENQFRHLWRHRETNGVNETGVIIRANGKLMIVLSRLSAWYEWQNKNVLDAREERNRDQRQKNVA